MSPVPSPGLPHPQSQRAPPSVLGGSTGGGVHPEVGCRTASPEGQQGHSVLSSVFYSLVRDFAIRSSPAPLPTWLPGEVRGAGLVLVCKGPLPRWGWRGASWAVLRGSGEGKQEGLDHREARSRKKHSAELGQKPLPSCVQAPESRKAARGSAPPWIQGSGRLGMLCPSPSAQGAHGKSEGLGLGIPARASSHR